MSLNVTYIYDEITVRDTARVMVALASQEKPRMPSNTKPSNLPPGRPLSDYSLATTILNDAYAGMDWVGYFRTADKLIAEGFSFPREVAARSAIAFALSASSVYAGRAFEGLQLFLGDYPAYGDLYLALAALKIRINQIDAAINLIELAGSCPCYHRLLHSTMQEKMKLVRPVVKDFITSNLPWLLKPRNLEKLRERMGLHNTIDAEDPTIALVRTTPADSFGLWQRSAVLQHLTSASHGVLPTLNLGHIQPEPLLDNPLTKLRRKLLLALLGHLDFTSVLNLRATCRELRYTVSKSSAYWSPLLLKTANLEMNLTREKVTPFDKYLELQTTLNMGRELLAGYKWEGLEAGRLRPFLSLCAVSILSTSPEMSSETIDSLMTLIFVTRVMHLFSDDLTKDSPSATFLLSLEPRLLRLFVQLLSDPSTKVISIALQILASLVTSTSHLAHRWIQQLIDWRVPVLLRRFVISIPSIIQVPVALLMSVLDGSPFLQSQHMDLIAETIAAPFRGSNHWRAHRFNGLWWIIVVLGQDEPSELKAELSCCDLTFELDEVVENGVRLPVTTFSGRCATPLSSKTIPTIKGSMSENLILLLHRSGDDGGLNFLGAQQTRGLGGVVSVPSASHPDAIPNLPCGTFYMWRDERPLTAELWKESCQKVQASISLQSNDSVDISVGITSHTRSDDSLDHKVMPLDDFSANLRGCTWQLTPPLGMLCAAWEASPESISELSIAFATRREIKEAADTLGRSETTPQLNRRMGETDSTYNIRQEVYHGSRALLNWIRIQIVRASYEEATRDVEEILPAIFRAWNTLPRDLMWEAGILPTKDFEIDKLITMHKTHEADAFLDMAQRMKVRWKDSPGEYFAVSRTILDRMLGTPDANLSSSRDFVHAPLSREKTRLKEIFAKWTRRLAMLHPAVASSDISFNFEILAAIKSKVDVENRMQSSPVHEKSIIVSKQSTKAILRSSSTAAIASLVAFVGITFALGAYLIGRKQTSRKEAK